MIIMEKETCDRCGFEMTNIQACHTLCTNCGNVLDCSDKGTVW